MTQHTADIVVNVLNREYPDVSRKIQQILQESLPDEPLTDYEIIPDLMERILKFKGIEMDKVNWHPKRGYKLTGKTIAGQTKVYRFAEIREILVAVLIRLYDPAKLLGFTTQKTKAGIMQKVSDFTGCHRVPLYQSASDAIVHYRIYADFKEEIDWLTAKINTKDLLDL